MVKKIAKITLFLILLNVGFAFPNNTYRKEKNKVYFSSDSEIKEADYNTFVELGNYYAKDKNFGYWRGEKIEGSDGKSFDILSKEMLNSYDEYAKDKNYVYYENKVLERANPKTIEWIRDYFLKDDKGIFWGTKKIENIKVKNFKKLGFYYWKNNNEIYYKDKKIENVDNQSFQVLNKNYAKDKNNIYYKENIIKDVDIKTFENFFDVKKRNYIDEKVQYYRDKNNIYYEGKKLDVDRKTFEVLNERYSKDKNYLYYNNEIVKGLDIKTFKIVSQDSEKINFFKDKNHLYNEYAEIMENIYAKTFEILKDEKYKDKNGIYRYVSNRFYIDFESMDSKSYEKLGGAYVKYKNNIYWYNVRIKNADVNSFKILDDNMSYAKDRNHIYNGSEEIESSLSGKIEDPETFEFLTNGISYVSLYGKDKYNVYYIEDRSLNSFAKYHYIYKINGIAKDKVKVLDKWFIKDDKNIYFKDKILENVDYDTFEILPDGDVKDKNRSYKDLIKQEEEKYYKRRSIRNIEDVKF